MKKEFLERDHKKTILMLSWRDIKAPKSGGAEIYTHEMLRRATNIKAIHFSPMFEGASDCEEIDGVLYIRRGSLKDVIREAKKFFVKHRNEIDYVIDQCNTFRFFTKFWVKKEKRIFMIFQLTREIWDYMLGGVKGKVGRAFETLMLKLNKNDPTLTMSRSTASDLEAVGFKPQNIYIIPPGLDFIPWTKEKMAEKELQPTFIYVGRYAKYKGIDMAIQAFGMVKKEIPNAKLWIVGKRDEEYIANELIPICKEKGISWGTPSDEPDVTFWGFVDENQKLELMSRARLLVCPSIREGWGMIISEAAAVGTPSVVFDAPGVCDAVDYGKAGYLCKKNTVQGLYELMFKAAVENDSYQAMKDAAYRYTCTLDWEKTALEFEKMIEDLG